MGKIVHLIDRSRVETREECPRMRFLGYDFDGDGLEPEGASLPLLSGIAIHAAHARLLAGESLESVIAGIIGPYKTELEARGLYGLDITKDIVREQSALLEGMLRVWAVKRMPMILEEYSVESIEQTFDWELAPGLVERLRMDAILRRRDDGLLFILDYKTLGYPSELFMEQKEHALQTCLYIQALKERSDEHVGGMMYEGLVKGQFRKDTARNSVWYGQRIQSGPYTLAYALRGEAGTIYQTEYTSKKGYRKVRTFEEMTPKEWAENYLIPGGAGIMPTNELFVVVPPVNPPAYELLRVKAQVIAEELAYHDELGRYRYVANSSDELAPQLAERILDLFAPLRTGRCYKYGLDNKCKFIDICFNQGAQPLAEGGGYNKRKPHHDTDLELVA